MTMNNRKNIVLFDFDGTITNKDSLFEFLKFYAGTKMYYFNMMRFFFVYIGCRLKGCSKDDAKLRLLRIFFKNSTKDELESKGKEFAEEHIIKIVRRDIFSRIVSHAKKGDKVVVVTASLSEWIRPWCELVGLEYIATKIKYTDDGLFAGEYDGYNCNRENKKKEIESRYELFKFEKTIVYGNSSDDRSMMSLALKKDRHFV